MTSSLAIVLFFYGYHHINIEKGATLHRGLAHHSFLSQGSEEFTGFHLHEQCFAFSSPRELEDDGGRGGGAENLN